MKNNNYLFYKNYLYIFLISLLFLLEVFVFKSTMFISFGLIIVGILNVLDVYLRYKLLITPITIFSVIWLILIPICSFEYPVMEPMNAFEWEKVLIFLISFSFGGILVSYFPKQKKNKCSSTKQNITSFNKVTLIFNYVVLGVSIISLFILFIKFGSIPLFDENASISKNAFRTSSVFNTLSYFGFISILLFLMNDFSVIKNKKFLILAFIYIVLLLLTAERFFVTLLILSCLFLFCKKKVDLKFLKKLILVGTAVLGIFFFILSFRGNDAEKQKYFIDTGIYDGTASELTRTEIFRYLGMQERLITKTYELIKPGYTKGTFTFAPLLKPFGIKPIEIPDIQIYGYTSKSIITKTYCDFGIFWWLSIIIFSFIINMSYNNYRRRASFIFKYFTITWLIFLTLSFYAYFDNLIILFLHFPMYVVLITCLNRCKFEKIERMLDLYENNNS